MPNEGGVTEPAFIAMPHAIPGVHLLLGAMVASGASLRWFRDQLGEVEVQTAARLNVDPFDLLTEQAAQISPGSRGVVFLPYMAGERSPIWHTNARGVFFGLSSGHPESCLDQSDPGGYGVRSVSQCRSGGAGGDPAERDSLGGWRGAQRAVESN